LIRMSSLLLIISLSLVFLMAIGIVLAIPFFGLGFLTDFNGMGDLQNNTNIAFLKYFQVINQIGVFILPAIIFAFLESRNVGQYFGTGYKPGLYLLFISILLIIVFIPAVNSMVLLNEQMKLPGFLKNIEIWMRESEDKTNLLTEAFLNVNTVGGLLLNLFIIGFLAALGEELLFRGVILRLFYDGLKNHHLAILISSLLFSAFHLQFYGFLPRTALGMVFGYIYIWSGSVWIPIILHFIFNGTTVFVAFLFQRGFISTDMESFGSTDNTYVILTSFVLTFLFLWVFYKHKKGIAPPVF
jgi:uncharacterized protein